MKSWLLVLLVVLAAPPTAGQQVWIDAESDPALSQWSVFTLAQVSVNRQSAAAHRGVNGIRFAQPLRTSEGTSLYYQHELNSAARRYYFRTWLRSSSFVTPTPASSRLVLARITLRYAGGPANGAVLSIVASGGGVGVSLVGQGARHPDGGTPSVDRIACGTLDSDWHLLEMEFSGRGGLSRISCAIDGQGPEPTEFPTFGSSEFGSVQFGGVSSSGLIGLEFDFDDLGGDSSPLPSGLALNSPDTISSSECVPLEVMLTSTFPTDAGVRAPYPMELGLSGGSSFRDEGCREPGPAVIEKGEARATVYTRVVDAGLTQLIISHPDVFSDARIVTVRQDESNLGSLYSLVSCASVPPPLVTLLLLWWGTRQRNFSYNKSVCKNAQAKSQ